MADSFTEQFMDALEWSEADVENVSAESFYRHEHSYGGWRVSLDLQDPDDLPLVRAIADELTFVQDDEAGEVWVRGLE